MTSRVVSALDYLAGAIVALAVLPLSISTFFLARGHHELWLTLCVLLGWPLSAAAAVHVVRMRARLMNWEQTLGVLIAAALATWVTAAIAFYALLVIAFSSTSCTSDSTGWATAMVTGAIVIYATSGALSLRRSFAAIWALPTGVALAFTWTVIVGSLWPTVPGFCGD
jgi:hypothetical protein